MSGLRPGQEEIADLLCAALDQDAAWRAALTPDTRLDGDLFLDSLELAAFAAALRARYGPAVDLPRHIADLELDAIIALTLAQVAAYVAQAVEVAADGATGHGAAEVARDVVAAAVAALGHPAPPAGQDASA